MRKYVIGLAIVIFLIFLVAICANYIQEYTENTYSLEEVEDGIYLITYKVSSSIPAENYDVAMICVNGNLLEYEGDVRVVYTENEPYCVVGSYVNRVRSDYVTVYIPKGSVKYQENVGIK